LARISALPESGAWHKEIYDLLEEQYGDIDDLEFENEVLENKLADQDEAYDSLEKDLSNANDYISELLETIDGMRQEIRELEDELDG
jgi:predicted  nucleic acid-binding Zn-ribbon protein